MKPGFAAPQSTREEALQKIVKNQELIIKDLENNVRKYKEKPNPDLSRLEQELKLKDKEIENLSNKIREIQTGYQQEKLLLNQYIEKSQGGFDNLKTMLGNERVKYDKKITLLEENYKVKVAALENENKLLTEELIRLKGFYLKENDRKSSVQVDENMEMLNDLKKMNEVFMQNESEHKEMIQQLKKEIEHNLDMFNQHLCKCSQEKRELSTRYLEDLNLLSPESNKFKAFAMEFTQQIKEFMAQINKKDGHNQALAAHLERVSADFEQIKEHYQLMIMNEEELRTLNVNDTMKMEVEKINTENQRLQLALKEKDAEISGLNAEIETFKMESLLMEQNLEEIKKIASSREWNSLNEIQALKMNNIKLTEIDENRQKIADEQMQIYKDELKKLQKFQIEADKISQGFAGMSEEIELVHRRLEEICRKQKEFFEKQPVQNLPSQSPRRQKLDNSNEQALNQYTEESDAREIYNKDTNPGARLDTRGGGGKTTRRTNTLQEHKTLSNKNTDIEKIKENEITKHRNELNSLKGFWEKCLDSLVPMTTSVEEFHAELKNISNKVDYLQNVVIPEKKLIDFVHEEINKFMDLVDEYNQIKEHVSIRVTQDLEVQKYQERIKKLEYELELTNVSLIHYMQSAEALKNMMNLGREAEEQAEAMMLRKEVQVLQEQNNVIMGHNKRLEQLYDGEINEMLRQVKNKGEYDLKIYSTLEDLMLIFNEYKEAVVDREKERLTLNEEVVSIKEYLRYAENMAKELKSLMYNSKQKISNKNIGDRLKALENEELVLLRNQLERVEQKSNRLEKVVAEERAFLTKKARELDLLENNPLKLYEELYESTLQEKTVIQKLNEKIDRLNQIYDNLLVDIQNNIELTQQMDERAEMNSDYQETIEVLKAELHIAKEEGSKEKALVSGEIEFLTENFKKSYEVLQTKTEVLEKLLEEVKQNNQELNEFNSEVEIRYQEAVKKVSEDFSRKFVAHRDMMNSIVQESRKYKEELAILRTQFKDNQEEMQNRYRISLQRLENLIDQTELAFQEKKNMAAADLVRKKKIEEEAIKENLSLYNLLKNQITSLKKQVEDGENARIQEKSIFVNFVENFKQSLSQLKQRIAQDRKKYEEETEFYRRLLNEKDYQFEQEVKTIGHNNYTNDAHYNNE